MSKQKKAVNMSKKQITNIVQLRDELCVIANEVRNHSMDRREAAELRNLYGKVMTSVTTELRGHELNKTAHNIKFLKGDEDA